jgi:signal transduction histidine kinase
MKRPWHIWIVFSAALAVVLCALGWMTSQAVRLKQVEREQHRQETIALRQSELEENIGPALWLMDTLLAAELAQQNSWPPMAYRAVYQDPWQGGAWGSPLLLAYSPYTLLHFEIAADGQVRSPQVPPTEMRPQASRLGVSAEQLAESGRHLKQMRTWANHEQLLAALPREIISLPESVAMGELASSDQTSDQLSLGNVASLPPNLAPQGFDNSTNPFDQQKDLQTNQELRALRGLNELENRRRVNGDFVKNSVRQQRIVQGQYQSLPQFSAQVNNTQAPAPQAPLQHAPLPPGPPSQQPAAADPGLSPLAAPHLEPGNFARINNTFRNASLASIREGISHPLWIEGSLVYARRVTIEDEQFVQGCLLDWPAIKTRLLDEIADRLVGADLVPIDDEDGSAGGDMRDGRMLAMLPVRLVVPSMVEPPMSAVSIPVEIYVAWGGVLLAALAVAGLLLGVMTLSERRAAFVSAVTHELRTPLTTFRMYSEMLAEGMVRDEADRQHYLQTLRNEADRLTHLVENVLSYARVERGRPGGKATNFHVAPLLERVADRLEDQVNRAGMRLVVDATSDAIAHADASAVEQIVVNLIDNAAKYAVGGDDGRIHLQATTADGDVEIKVRDHGPGIDRKEARRLFRPFCKSAKDAAGTAPGVGLGLALSRRLASAMGGSLRLDGAENEGACFVLRLPAG